VEKLIKPIENKLKNKLKWLKKTSIRKKSTNIEGVEVIVEVSRLKPSSHLNQNNKIRFLHISKISTLKD